MKPRNDHIELDRRRFDSAVQKLGVGEPDVVAVEEPLQILIHDDVFATVMRTPGQDHELVRGLLFAEGVISGADDIQSVTHCLDVEESARGNVVRVLLQDHCSFDIEDFRRNLLSSSACGVCGKDSIDGLRERVPDITASWRVPSPMLLQLPRRLREAQDNFSATGGVHAAGLFDRRGVLLALREDIGRHNAVDKIVGASIRGTMPLDETILQVSGRASFEIVQKALCAGIPIVASVSAPSSLAVELAAAGGQTLVGFVREQSFNVYCGAHRLTDDPSSVGDGTP